MADADAVRRREIRKRKILEHSEARLNRITSTKKYQETDGESEKVEHLSQSKGTQKSGLENVDDSLHLPDKCLTDVNIRNSASKTDESLHYHGFDTFDRSKSINEDENSYSVSSNGATQRSCVNDNYKFPKKVSDAETRSFVRSRCDARRNSTCTQMMMETFQFSSFSLALFRPWIAAVLSIILKGYFLLTRKFPIFQTLLFPYLLLEVAFLSWTKFESQVNSKQGTSSFIPGVLVLFGFPLNVVSGFNSVLYLVQSALQDLAVYVFSFIFLHFLSETYV